MPRHTQGDRIETGGGEIGNAGVRPARRDQRQRPGPEVCRKVRAHWPQNGEFVCRLRRFHVNDQRVEARPCLGGEYPCDSLRVRGVGGETVDSLGGHADKLATRQRIDSSRDRLANVS